MNAEIIAVGSELLLGQIANTNGQHLSKELAALGISIFRHTVIGDNTARLHEAITEAEKRADLVVLTGGLGPTEDDLTKDVAAEHAGRKLIEHPPSMKSLTQFFEERGMALTEANKRQALYLEDSCVLENHNGLACGVAFEQNDTHYMLLPGPPHEMKMMFEKEGKPYLLKNRKENKVIESKIFRFTEIGESTLEAKLKDIIGFQSNPTIAPLASEGEVIIRVTAAASTAEEADTLIAATEQQILERAGEYCYAVGEKPLIELTLDRLRESGKTIAAAESLTGGWFAKKAIDIEGASAVFAGGAVAYSASAKEKLLGVKAETIASYGTVSRECAEEMAVNVKDYMQADVGISFTGVAGPDPLEGHPPGTVWIGLAVDNEVKAFPLELRGSRKLIRHSAVFHGYRLLWKEKVINNDVF
ncbi:competence/damage-inducible protein A [Sinobaca sp. H24]|uniref:competence/damage-inducible protein A n=2 Tax=Sinobaca sp. H24 TaxID=2923376 RepID=UPI00207A299C|nr:competence/damage-inducible protein A [Sinobaca sp. H24]